MLIVLIFIFVILLLLIVINMQYHEKIDIKFLRNIEHSINTKKSSKILYKAILGITIGFFIITLIYSLPLFF